MSDKVIYKTTKENILAVDVPRNTRTWEPVSNERLINTTLEAIEKGGFSVDKEIYTWAREGKQSNGKYTISNVSDSEMQLQIGWQNSYDKSLSLKFAIGVQIFICSNGAISGDIGAFKKKHLTGIQEFSVNSISEYIRSSGETFQKMQEDRERLKQIEMTKRTTAELIGRMFIEEEIITSTQLNIIKREIDNPSFDYGAEGSLWEVYNHTTLALKESSPATYFKQHIDAHNFIMGNRHAVSDNGSLILI